MIYKINKHGVIKNAIVEREEKDVGHLLSAEVGKKHFKFLLIRNGWTVSEFVHHLRRIANELEGNYNEH